MLEDWLPKAVRWTIGPRTEPDMLVRELRIVEECHWMRFQITDCNLDVSKSHMVSSLHSWYFSCHLLVAFCGLYRLTLKCTAQLQGASSNEVCCLWLFHFSSLPLDIPINSFWIVVELANLIPWASLWWGCWSTFCQDFLPNFGMFCGRSGEAHT